MKYDPIAAALTPGVYSDSEREALIHSLRQQEALGMLGAMSQLPGASRTGAAMAKNALTQAGTLGNRQNEQAQQAYDNEWNELTATDPEWMFDPETGRTGARRYNPRLGAYEDVPGSENMIPTSALPKSRGLGGAGGGKSTYKVKDDVLGEVLVRMNPDGSVDTLVPGTGWVNEEELIAFKEGRLGERNEAVAGRSESQRFGAKEGEALSENKQGVLKAPGEFSRLRDIYKDMSSAIKDGGGRSGWFVNKLPTLTTGSLMLENAINQAGLTELPKHKLYPLSDRDVAIVFKAAVPADLPSEALQDWADWKAQGAEMLAAVAEVREQYLAEYGYKDSIPAGSAAHKAMMMDIDAVRKEYDWDRNFFTWREKHGNSIGSGLVPWRNTKDEAIPEPTAPQNPRKTLSSGREVELIDGQWVPVQ